MNPESCNLSNLDLRSLDFSSVQSSTDHTELPVGTEEHAEEQDGEFAAAPTAVQNRCLASRRAATAFGAYTSSNVRDFDIAATSGLVEKIACAPHDPLCRNSAIEIVRACMSNMVGGGRKAAGGHHHVQTGNVIS